MKKLFLFFYFFINISLIFPQMSFYSLQRDYSRALQVKGDKIQQSSNYHTKSVDIGNYYEDKNSLWISDKKKYSFGIQYPEVWNSFNSSKAWGGNDGPVWQGKGLNSQISVGIDYSTENISINFEPLLWASQNSDFNIISTTSSSGYGDYWTVFDNLQRFGDNYYFDFSFGESDIHFYWNDFSIGVSNESIILGPGQVNNIILGNNAGGFPHIDLGTDGTYQINKFGNIEFKWLWGILQESEFFDEDPDNDFGWISGFYFSFSPSVIPNFMIGFNHQYYKPLSSWDANDIIRGIPFIDRSNSPGDVKDMMISIPFSWLLPQAGFEFYGEWARNDNFGNFEDLYNSPEHTHGFTLGINQIIKEWHDNFIMVSGEFTSLEQERTYEIRAAGPWYRHAWTGWTQGYTYKGQLLGASIGPGSDSQWLKVSWYNGYDLWALSLKRVAHDKDYFYKLFSENVDNSTIDEYTEFSIGIENLIITNHLSLYYGIYFANFLNDNYKAMNDVQNVYCNFGLEYRK